MVLPYKNSGGVDYYHVYRPRKFSEMIGHSQVVKSIRSAVNTESPSRAFMLLGTTGTGKTTTARIIATALNCENLSEDGDPCTICNSCVSITAGKCPDVMEINAADTRGIDGIRAVSGRMKYAPMTVKKKVFILDEAHQLTKEAQSSILKDIEDAPSHVCVILCSTDPKKILPTVRNRCQKFEFRPLSAMDMRKLLEAVSTYEGHILPNNVYGEIIQASEGSARNGLVNLQQIIQMGDYSQQAIQALLGSGAVPDPTVFEICKELQKNYKRSWSNISRLFTSVKSQGAPAIGMMIGGYFRNQLLRRDDGRAAFMLSLFAEPFPEGTPGENMLVNALYVACKEG